GTRKSKFQKRNSKIQLFALWILDFLFIGIFQWGAPRADRRSKRLKIKNSLARDSQKVNSKKEIPKSNCSNFGFWIFYVLECLFSWARRDPIRRSKRLKIKRTVARDSQKVNSKKRNSKIQRSTLEFGI